MVPNLPPATTEADALVLTRACALLGAGAVIAVPTETVYGLAADARNSEALARLFALKARPANRPFSLLLPDASALDALAADLTDAARTLAHTCWPGPLTLIVRARADTGLGIVPAPASLGLRVPDHPLTLALLRRYGAPLAAPSANPSGALSPTCAEHVYEHFGVRVPFVLDGGPCAIGLESTLVDCTTETPRILRPGALETERIASLLNLPRAALESARQEAQPLRTPLYLLSRADLLTHLTARLDKHQPTAVLAFTPAPSVLRDHPLLFWHTAPANAAGFAHALYDALSQIERCPARVALVQMPPAQPAWSAILIRLQRYATAGAVPSKDAVC